MKRLEVQLTAEELADLDLVRGAYEVEDHRGRPRELSYSEVLRELVAQRAKALRRR